MDALDRIAIGGWQADRSEGRLRRGAECRPIEPKVMDLLFVLAARPNQVLSREVLTRALWPDTIVGEDALARCVFKLRRALDDDPRVQRCIETIPKRGYRLIQPRGVPAPRPARWRVAVAASVAIAAAFGGSAWYVASAAPGPAERMLARADDSYFQYGWADNEAAITLYERALAADTGSAGARAGLSNALVQRVLRWPEGRDSPALPGSVLGAALASGRLATPAVRAQLQRPLALAREAASLRGGDPEVLRALGLVLSANGRLDDAAAVYDRALAIAPDEWGVLINRADLFDIQARPEAARPLLERAYASMDRGYASAPARIRPWQARLGIEIARRYEAAGDLPGAERWYRRVVADDPAARLAADRLAALWGQKSAG
jgi:transcriptional activator of cad operon